MRVLTYQKLQRRLPEVGFPMTWTEERNKLEFLMEHNLITRKELLKVQSRYR